MGYRAHSLNMTGLGGVEQILPVQMTKVLARLRVGIARRRGGERYQRDDDQRNDQQHS